MTKPTIKSWLRYYWEYFKWRNTLIYINLTMAELEVLLKLEPKPPQGKPK